MERNSIKHVEEERLEAYAMSTLDQDQVPAVEEHLLFCDTCQDQLEAVERYVLAMRSASARIAKEEAAEASVPGVWDRVSRSAKAWLHTPAPIWSAGVFALAAIAAIIMAVGLHVEQRPGPAINVELRAEMGATTGTAQAGHALNLRLDNRGISNSPDWRIEVVDSEGGKIWAGAGTWLPNAVTATVPKSFKPGTLFVRLLKEGQEPVREFKLVVQ